MPGAVVTKGSIVLTISPEWLRVEQANEPPWKVAAKITVRCHEKGDLTIIDVGNDAPDLSTLSPPIADRVIAVNEAVWLDDAPELRERAHRKLRRRHAGEITCFNPLSREHWHPFLAEALVRYALVIGTQHRHRPGKERIVLEGWEDRDPIDLEELLCMLNDHDYKVESARGHDDDFFAMRRLERRGSYLQLGVFAFAILLAARYARVEPVTVKCLLGLCTLAFVYIVHRYKAKAWRLGVPHLSRWLDEQRPGWSKNSLFGKKVSLRRPFSRSVPIAIHTGSAPQLESVRMTTRQ